MRAAHVSTIGGNYQDTSSIHRYKLRAFSLGRLLRRVGSQRVHVQSQHPVDKFVLFSRLHHAAPVQAQRAQDGQHVDFAVGSQLSNAVENGQEATGSADTRTTVHDDRSAVTTATGGIPLPVPPHVWDCAARLRARIITFAFSVFTTRSDVAYHLTI